MQIATLWVHTHKNGSNVFKKGVTPAEAMVYVRQFKDLVGRFPLTDISILGTAQSVKSFGEDGKPVLKARTDGEEIARLHAMFSKRLLDEMFPGARPKLPETFDEAFPVTAQVEAGNPDALGACVDTPGESNKDAYVINPVEKKATYASSPTLEEWLERGYDETNYPPVGYFDRRQDEKVAKRREA
jgi:hypothetical protein